MQPDFRSELIKDDYITLISKDLPLNFLPAIENFLRKAENIYISLTKAQRYPPREC